MSMTFILVTAGLLIGLLAVASYVFYFSDRIHSDESE